MPLMQMMSLRILFVEVELGRRSARDAFEAESIQVGPRCLSRERVTG
jgi:hypothetical protein